MMRQMVVIGALSISVGCSNAAAPNQELNPSPSEGVIPGVSLNAAGDRFEHLDTLEVELVNDGLGEIGYNLCSSWRERETEAGWERVESLRVCTADLRILEPGERAIWREPVDESWGAARYRFGTNVWPELGESVTIRTGTFEVSPRP